MRSRASTAQVIFLLAILLLSSLLVPLTSAAPNPDAPHMNVPVAGNAQMTLSWTVPNDNGDAIQGYNIYRGTTLGQEAMYHTVTGASTTTYTDTGLTNGQTYSYYVVAVNSHGASEPSNTVFRTPYGPPGTPTAVTGVPGSGNITLSWTSPYDNGGTPITLYRIYRGTAPGAEIFLNTTEETTYVDDGLSEGRTFYYTISAVTDPEVTGYPEGSRSAEIMVVLTDVPGPVTTLVASANNGSVVLSWTAPADVGGSPITGYQVHRGTQMGLETFLSNSPTTTFNDTALANGQVYFYRVSASNSAGPGPLSNEVSATPLSVPSAPLALLAYKGDGKAILSWTTPTITGGTPLIEYRIYRGTASGAEIYLTKTSSLNYTDGNLTNGRTYFYKISAVNALGEGPKSTAVSIVPLTVPSAPGALLARGGLSTVVLTWVAPTATGGANISGYNIYRGDHAGTETLLMSVGNVLTFTDTARPADATYYYYVTAINGAGEGAPSTEAHATTFGLPSEPLALSAVPGNSTVHLRWSAPTDNGRTPVMLYSVYRGTTAGGEVKLTTVQGFEYSDQGLSNGQTYYYRVSAINAVGEGALSQEISSIPALPPTEPVWLIAVPSSQQASLNWSAPLWDGGSPITTYSIYRSTSPGGSKPLLTTMTTTRYTDSGLENGVTYYYQVSASNAAGQGPLSSEVSVVPARAPGQPMGLQAVGGLGQVTLTWTEPTDEGGSVISGYNVYRGISPGGEGAVPVALGVRAPFTDTGLDDSTTYYYQVSGVNQVGSGLRSEEVAVSTMYVPSSPTHLVAASGDRQIDLTWDASASDDGSPLTYRLYRSSVQGEWRYLATVSTTTHRDAGLTNGITYHYYVTAVNATGEGRETEAVSAIPCTQPSVPLDLTASAGDGMVIVQWNPPNDNGGSAVTGYRLYWSNSPSGGFEVIEVGGTSYFHSGLTNGQPYHYKVTAVNAAGEGPMSEPATATPVTKPGTPYGLQAKGGDGKVVLTWTEPLESAVSGIQGYRVYRGNSSLDMKLYDVATGTTYTDLNVINGHTYYYRVSAVNATGEGRMSTEASATPSSPPQDLMSVLGRNWLEIMVIVIAVLVVVGTIFIMFGSGMLSLGKKEDE